MLLGPDPLGSFIPIAVKSIHRKRMPVKEVRGGQTASFALKKVCSKQLSNKEAGMHMQYVKTNPSLLSSGARCTDQAFIHKERDGNGVTKAVPTGHLGV